MASTTFNDQETVIEAEWLNEVNTHVHTQEHAPLYSPVVTEATATRTLALTDAGKYLRCTDAGGCTITVPPQASVAWAADTEIHGRGTLGQVTFTEGAGVTIAVAAAPATFTTVSHQGATWTLKREAADEWVLVGLLVEA